jgi:hypothetical protein
MYIRAVSTLFGLSFAALATACAGQLPEPIYRNQVDQLFPDAEASTGGEITPPGDTAATTDATDATAATDASATADGPALGVPVDVAAGVAPPETSAETAHQLHVLAGHCAARLNGHRSTAETVSIIQGIIGGIGGVTGGVGSALAVAHISPDVDTAMGVMGSVGAGVTFVGNLILGFVANPLEEARLHGLGLRSWEMAVALQEAHADASAVQLSLERCAQDLGPEVHLIGSGEPYAE